jgi:hypothetical protein
MPRPSPGAAAICTNRSVPHSSSFARLPSGAFYGAIVIIYSESLSFFYLMISIFATEKTRG